jgi:hypothetical protein
MLLGHEGKEGRWPGLACGLKEKRGGEGWAGWAAGKRGEGEKGKRFSLFLTLFKSFSNFNQTRNHAFEL